MTVCVNPDHFDTVDGQIVPQPWMQMRNVATGSAESIARTFPPAGGGNKNLLLHTVTCQFQNASPVPQNTWGMITRGGATNILQARSRGGFVVLSGMAKGLVPGALGFASTFGCGADNGLGGVLSIGIGYCVADVRMNAVTFHLVPERSGLLRLNAGEMVTGQVQVWWSTEQYESGVIDGGDTGCESRFLSGDTRLDLFAVPIID